MKGKLLKYRPTKFQALNSYTFDFELTILKGLLFKREKIIVYGIPEHDSIKKYTDHWDELIKADKVLKF
jgi:hypothetical protein